MRVPNIYEYATSELSQDATLAYILSWAKPEYRAAHPKLNQLGENLLRKLVESSPVACRESNPLKELKIEKVEVATQYNKVDVWAVINDTVGLIIEDKTDTYEHSDQIARYIEAAERRCEEDAKQMTILPVYVKTGNEALYEGEDEKKVKYGKVFRKDILAVLAETPDTGNTIIEEFRAHLQRWEDETNAYATKPINEWGWLNIQGYYMALHKWLRDEKLAKDKWTNWHYISNPAGGFLGFSWHWCKFGKRWMNLQIETSDRYEKSIRSRLLVRIGTEHDKDQEKTKVCHGDMREAKEAIDDAASNDDFQSVIVKKAGAYRGGSGASVVELLFDENDESYMATKDGGLLDLCTTKMRLYMAMRLLDAVCPSSDVKAPNAESIE